MSADNYMYVDREHGKFTVTMGFASDEKHPKPSGGSARFDTFIEAINYASAQWTEYGIQISNAALMANSIAPPHESHPEVV